MLFIRYLPRSSGVCADAIPMPASTAADTKAPSRSITVPRQHPRTVVLPVARAWGPSQQKGRRAAPCFRRMRPAMSRRRRGFLGLLLDRPGILALGIDVAVDELDHANRRRVAVAVAGLEHA